MKPAARIITLLGICFALAGTLRADTLKLFIFAGQTNMAGKGKIEDLPEKPVDLRAPQKDVLYAARSSKSHGELVVTGSESNPWTMLQPVNGTFGPEIAFGRTVSESLTHQTIAIVKIAAAGKNSLADHWNPDAAADPKLYQEMLNFVRAAVERREQAGDTVEIAGFIWYQGEADAHNDKTASAYQENLSRFIARVRADLKTPKLPFVAVRIGVRQRDAGQFEPQVRAAIEAACTSTPQAAWVDVDGLPLLDGKFLDSTGELEAGKRLASAWLKLADAKSQ